MNAGVLPTQQRGKKKSSEVAQLLDDRAGDVFLDLAMTRNRLAHFRSRILIPIVLAAVPDEDTTHSRQLLDEFDALHET